MSELHHLEKPLTITPTKGGETYTFRTVEDFRKWFQDELNNLGWLRTGVESEGPGFAKQTFAPLLRVWSDVETTLQRIANRPDERNDQLPQLREQLHAWKNTPIRVASSDPRAVFASAIAEKESKGVAVYALAGMLLDAEKIPDALNPARGLIHARLYLDGISSFADATRPEQVLKDRQLWDELVEYAKQKSDYFLELTDTAQIQFKELIGHHSAEFASLYDRTNEQLQAISDTYDQGLALQAPVTFWSRKADEYRKRAIAYSIIFAIMLVIAGGVLAAEIVYWLLPSLRGETDQGLGFLALATLVTTATLVIWPLRIVSKMLLSNMHLETEADQRATMAHTYLALLRQDDGIAKEDRQLMLKTLFRTINTGIIKDDGTPASAVELFTRLIGR
jgi:hypothetical protein